MRLLTADSFEPIFEPLLGRRVGYVPTAGGVGDMLGEMAALQLFAHFGVEYHVETLAGGCEAEVLVLAAGGPGPLCPPGMDERLADIAAGVPVTVLPRSLTSPVDLRVRRFHVRDRHSLTHRPDGIVMPDLILGLEVAIPGDPLEERGVWLRCDGAGRFARHGGEDPVDVCATAADYLALAARYEAIVTDRPDFAMAGLVQGRHVTLLPDRTPVNRSLWETWLADLGCHWLDAHDVIDGEGMITPVVPPAAPSMITAEGYLGHASSGAFDPRSLQRLLSRFGADLRALEARMAGWEHGQEQLIQSVARTHERLLGQGDALQGSIYSLQRDLRTRESAPPSHDEATRDAARRYALVVSRIRDAVRERLPRDAKVLVISRGDDDLLQLFGRRAGHFPQVGDGVYAGHHPPDAATAIGHLLDLMAAGWEYLLLPATAFWWLDHYAGFRAHLVRTHAVVHRDEGCVIFGLRARSEWADVAAFVADFRGRERRFPAVLDWTARDGQAGCVLGECFPELPVFRPPDATAPLLPYLDASIDVVAVPAGDGGRLAEALRVATAAVLEWEEDATASPRVVIRTLDRWTGTGLQPTGVIRPVRR